MKSITFELETVTPLFLSGAEARGPAELRPPAFRGALRYWLRAALAGAIGDHDLPRLHELESRVFGSPGDEGGGQASAVTVRFSGDLEIASQVFSKGRSQKVQRNGKEVDMPRGRDYLYWSMNESGRDANYQPPKHYIDEKTSFNLCLNTRPGPSNAERAFADALAATWLLLNLGGLGSRSHRTGGSLSPQGPFSSAGFEFGLSAQSLEQATEALQNGLQKVRDHFRSYDTVSPGNPSEFDVLHPDTCRIWVLGIWPNAMQAVDEIGSAMWDVRNRAEPDHQQVANWVNGKKINTVQRAAFGLPLPFNYTNGPRGIVVEGRRSPKEKQINRRASPLWLKVSKVQGLGYIGIASLFNARFFPIDELLYASKPKAPPVPPPVDYALITDWLDDKKRFPASQEVKYA